MQSILHFIGAFSFWGSLFEAIIVWGLCVPFNELVELAQSSSRPFSIFGLYILCSPVIFVVTTITFFMLTKQKWRKNNWEKYPIPFYITVYVEPLLWVPYKGVDIRELFHLKEYNLDFKLLFREIRIHIYRFFELIVWWLIVGTMILSTINTPNNIFIKQLNVIDPTRLLYCLLAVAFFLILLKVLTIIMWKIDKSISKQNDSTKRETKPTKRYRKGMPAACKACGGPYPNCKTSCKLFDD